MKFLDTGTRSMVKFFANDPRFFVRLRLQLAALIGGQRLADAIVLTNVKSKIVDDQVNFSRTLLNKSVKKVFSEMENV